MSKAKFMERAIELARQSQGGPFGCVIVKDGEIVGEGYTRVFQDCDPTAHGEMVALRAAARRLGSPDLSGCEVYNISVSCPMCMAALYWARVDKLYYCCVPQDAADIGFDNLSLALELAKPLEQRTLSTEQMMELRPAALAAYQIHAKRPDRLVQSALAPDGAPELFAKE
jgi:tRNA(Arg) A34 adenosine deaminase TadA